MGIARGDLYVFGMTGKEHSPDNSDRMSERIDAYRAEVLRAAADVVEFWHGQAPDVYSPQDSAHLLRHIANGGDPKTAVYP